MTLNSPPSGENTTLVIYPWIEKEVGTFSAPGTTATFTAVATRTLKTSTGISTTPTPTQFEEDTTNGLWTYWKYSSGWTQTTGHRSQRDCDVYFRKNGVDTPVDGATTAITSITAGATYITVTFAQSVTSTQADSIILSYQYNYKTNPLPTTFCIKDYNPKQSGRDFSTLQCLGGVTHKRRQPQDLAEISLSVYKTGNGLASYMLGKLMATTENSLSVTSSSGGNYIQNCAITIVVKDPDDYKNKIGVIMTNCGATALDHKGGADSDLEESVTFKCDPEDYSEFGYRTT